ANGQRRDGARPEGGLPSWSPKDFAAPAFKPGCPSPIILSSVFSKSDCYLSARVGFQPHGGDGGEAARFVVVRRVARNADDADDLAVAITDQHAAGHGHDATHGAVRGGDELRRLFRALSQTARTGAQRDRAVGFADRDVRALQAGAVLGG